MTYFNTSRSRTLDHLRCPRARYILHEREGTGVELVRQAVPLVTGVSVHKGMATGLATGNEESAVHAALQDYENVTRGRGLDISDLESQSFVYSEQRALAEALTRLGFRRMIPRVHATYDVIEIETFDKRLMVENDKVQVFWRSIPDALLRKKDDGELYLMSWKTASELPTDSDARVDMQGVSEAWALQARLDEVWNKVRSGEQLNGGVSERLVEVLRGLEVRPRIRGIQMGFLVKGMRRVASKEMTARYLTAEQIAAGWKLYRTENPLIYGYVDSSSLSSLGSVSWTRDYKCVGPHPMRKSKWYPTGMCETPGKSHKRGDEWTSFAVWETPEGVKGWMDGLPELDKVAGDPMEMMWTLPVPNFRTIEQVRDWYEQTRTREEKIAMDLLRVREVEKKIQEDPSDEVTEELRVVLNETFPQTTDQCNHWFGRNCPACGICWGPDHIKDDPVGSGLYQWKVQLDEREVGVGIEMEGGEE